MEKSNADRLSQQFFAALPPELCHSEFLACFSVTLHSIMRIFMLNSTIEKIPKFFQVKDSGCRERRFLARSM